MVRVKGPSVAQAASGSLGGALVFSSAKGRSYVKKLTKPKNPNSDPQRAMRAINAFLARYWNEVPAASQATWTALADETNVAPYHAFLAHNLERWRNYKPPTQAYPAAEVISVASSPTITLSQVGRGINFYIKVTAVNQNWAYAIIQVDSVPDPATWNRLIHIMRLQTTDAHNWHWGPVDPGLYRFKLHNFSTSGGYNVTPKDRSITVV